MIGLGKLYIPQSIGYGGSIAYHKCEAESIFCFVGGGRNTFYCYSVNGGRWFNVANSRLPQNDGSSLVSCYQREGT